MSPLEFVLVGTVMGVSIFLFEAPTGIVADTASRRLSIVVGNVIRGLGFVVVGVVVAVWPILFGYAPWGRTFTSGAQRPGSRTRSRRTTSRASTSAGHR